MIQILKKQGYNLGFHFHYCEMCSYIDINLIFITIRFITKYLYDE
jgi:hypothetical protein